MNSEKKHDIDDMTEKPQKNLLLPEKGLSSGLTLQLLRSKAKTGFRSPHFWIIIALFIIFTFIYYYLLESYRDIYIIIFFYPLIYAAVVYRIRGVIVTGVVFLCILLPQALVVSQDPVFLVRTLIFAAFAYLVAAFGAVLLNYLENQLEAYQEILSLNEKLNDYIDKLHKTQRQLIQAAKLSSLGQLSAAVAHELNNPLAGILVYARLAKEKIVKGVIDKEKLKGNMEKIESAIKYCNNIIQGLLDFARQTEPLLRPVTVERAIDKAMSLAGHQIKMKTIEVSRTDAPSQSLVVADFNQLVQVIINLILNAVQAMKEGGRLNISTSQEDSQVKIAISDTGDGIPPENMEKLFTPFFTTKEDVKGVGLGLAISYGIIERHGGKIEVQSDVGKGSTFTIVLPAYQSEEPREAGTSD
jgi:signal transduction histidine kinase